ncbi:uncharacterized protein [Triticum aestivum]|uniref:uncharacterized protein n=1 Tax=Triticum aestivum TaxID=4565 RepID=UPI001D01CEBF|nr:uncharacterized protein LOC123161696 [Triticum aestivum]
MRPAWVMTDAGLEQRVHGERAGSGSASPSDGARGRLDPFRYTARQDGLWRQHMHAPFEVLLPIRSLIESLISHYYQSMRGLLVSVTIGPVQDEFEHILLGFLPFSRCICQYPMANRQVLISTFQPRCDYIIGGCRIQWPYSYCFLQILYFPRTCLW